MTRFITLRQSGITLIEVMVAVAIIAIIAVTVGYSVTTYVQARAALLTDTKALYLAEEGYEILRVLRDEDWNNIDSLTLGNTYSFDVTTTTISLSNTVEVVDSEYYRSFKVSEIERDANDDITFSGFGSADSGARMVMVAVFGPTGTTSLSGVLTNINAI